MKKFTLLWLGLLTALTMQAQIIHVPGDYPTIQLGINAATPGDTVLVAEGTYYEQINFLGKKPLMVASEFLMDGDTSHISNTIIDGSQITSVDSGSIVYFISGEDTTSILCGFTLRNGNKGTRAFHPSGDTIQSGGAIFLFGSGAKILYNHISNNTLNGNGIPTTGAGISAGNWWEDNHWVVVDHNTIDHNSTYSDLGGSFGGGICITCNTRIINNVIDDNLCQGTGSTHVGGSGFFVGGEVVWEEDLIAEVRNNVIRNNQSINSITGAGWSGGSGGFSQCNTLIFSGNTVENNGGYNFGALHLYNPRTGNSVTNNIFKNNTSSGYAGALHIINESQEFDTVMVESNYFISNTGQWGGGIFSDRNPVLLQNNVFTGNHATINGGALFINGNFSLGFNHLAILINNSFHNNSSVNRGGAIFSSSAKPLIFNSIFWNDTSSIQNSNEIYLNNGADTVEIAYSNIDTSFISGNGLFLDGGGNINADPLYTDTDSLTIPNNSPCINTGILSYTCQCGDVHTCPAYDILGKARPWYDYPDLGAYEFHPGAGIGPELTGGTGLDCNSRPNPVTSSATICYTLVESCHVTVTVYNSFGQLVGRLVNGCQQKGEQKVIWNAETLPAGMYFYRIGAGEMVGTGKVIKQ